MPTFSFKIMVILVSLSTATGVLFHDARVDKLMSTLLSMPLTSSYEANPRAISFSEFHTHSEQVSSESVRSATQTSGIPPRSNEDKKYLLQKHTAKGHHFFDNYNLPMSV